MATVIRYDAGLLQKPRRTPQGFLRVDGRASRCGVLEYRDGLHGVRRELRLPEDVHADESLAGFEGAPVTDDHPSEMVNPDNAQAIAKGMVLGMGRRDGEYVTVSMVVTDKALIRKMEAGKRQLSVGYNVELDETPGVHPKYGKYDAIQRRITPNHLAVVDAGRAGPQVSVRMDGQREDVWVEVLSTDSKLTTVEDGHQHVIYETTSPGGSTSYGMAKGADAGHDHAWIRNRDGSITLTENAGHTHTILVEERGDARHDCKADCGCGAAQNLHNAGGVPKSARDASVPKDGSMTLEEAMAEIEKLKAQLASKADGEKAVESEEKKPAFLEEKAKKAEEKADALTKKVAELEAAADNARKDAEKARADADEKIRLDAEATAKARQDAEAQFQAKVAERVALETAANVVLGATDTEGKPVDRSAIANRDLKLQIIQRVDGDDVPAEKPDAYVDAMYDGALKRHAKGATAVAATAAAVAANRADAANNTIPAAGTAAEAKASEALKAQLSTRWMGTPSSKETK